MVLVIVLVNLSVAVVVFGVCILRQVLILRKEVQTVAKIVLDLEARVSHIGAVGSGGNGYAGGTGGMGGYGAILGGAGGRWKRTVEGGGQGGRGFLSYKWED